MPPRSIVDGEGIEVTELAINGLAPRGTARFPLWIWASEVGRLELLLSFLYTPEVRLGWVILMLQAVKSKMAHRLARTTISFNVQPTLDISHQIRPSLRQVDAFVMVFNARNLRVNEAFSIEGLSPAVKGWSLAPIAATSSSSPRPL